MEEKHFESRSRITEFRFGLLVVDLEALVPGLANKLIGIVLLAKILKDRCQSETRRRSILWLIRPILKQSLSIGLSLIELCLGRGLRFMATVWRRL